MKIPYALLGALACALLLPAASVGDDAPAERKGPWPLWGGRPDRNMVSDETGLPSTFSDDAKHLRWKVDLGTQTYGNPVVAGGKVYVGTNNGKPRDPKVSGDKGILMCFAEADGAFLWQAVHDKLSTGNAEDWAEIGICSTPHVVGDRVYYVNNRAELVCVDAEGFHDGENDGRDDEKYTGKQNADIVWTLDFRKELGVVPFQASASSPLVVGDLVFAVTGHGVDEQTGVVKNPAVASFVAVDRNTGKIVWKDASPGEHIVEGQWGSPAYGVVDGKPQVCFPGGDGWVYAFEPKTGKLIWKFDCKAHEKAAKKKRKSSNQLVATPVYLDHRLLIAIGPNPEAGGVPGCLRAIDARKTGDVTKTAELWKFGPKNFGCSISTVAARDGLVYIPELDGILHCVDLETGKEVWKHDLFATIWGSALVADKKVYVRNEDGDVVVLDAARKLKVLATNSLPDLHHGTVVVSGGTLYVAGTGVMYAIKAK